MADPLPSAISLKCNDNSPGSGSVDPDGSDVLAWLSTPQTAPESPGRRILDVTEMRGLASLMYQGRRDRERFFDAALFSDPAWDMLLAAYCLPTVKGPLSVTGLCHASGTSLTTALRWITHLCDLNLLARSRSDLDGRVTYVALTERGRNQIEAYLNRFSQRLVQPIQDQ